MIKVKAKKDKAYAGDKLLQAGQKLTIIYEDKLGNSIKRKAIYKGFNKKLDLFIIEKDSAVDVGNKINLRFRSEGINAQKIYVEEWERWR